MQFIYSLFFSLVSLVSSFIPQKTLTEGVLGQPLSLNPLEETQSQVDADIISLIFSSLVKYDENGNLIGDLAEFWQISDDGKEYIFQLKSDLKFHNGFSLVTDDILWTLDQHQKFKGIRKEKIDNQSFKIALDKPLVPLLDFLTTVKIVPKNSDQNGVLIPIGSGPYQILRIDKKGDFVEKIVLDTNNHHYKIKRIIFRFFDNPESIKTAAKLGEINSFLCPDCEDISGFNYFESPLLSRYYALFFNFASNNELLKDKTFRQNIAKVINKKQMVAELENKFVDVNTCIKNSWAENLSLEVYSDETSSEKIYSHELDLTFPDLEQYEKVADLLKKDLEKIGLKVRLKKIPFDLIVSEILEKKNFDLLLFGQEIVGRDPDRYSFWHSTQKEFPGLNFSSFNNMRVDKALEESRKIFDQEERKKHYLLFQRILHDELPAIYLFQPKITYAVSQKISGVSISNLYTLEERFLGIEGWE